MVVLDALLPIREEEQDHIKLNRTNDEQQDFAQEAR